MIISLICLRLSYIVYIHIWYMIWYNQMYKIYVVNNFNSNVNCIPPYIKLRKTVSDASSPILWRTLICLSTETGSVPCIYYLCSRTPLALTTKNATNRYVIRRIRGGGGGGGGGWRGRGCGCAKHWKKSVGLCIFAESVESDAGLVAVAGFADTVEFPKGIVSCRCRLWFYSRTYQSRLLIERSCRLSCS
jgi:hypothetical protein